MTVETTIAEAIFEASDSGVGVGASTESHPLGKSGIARTIRRGANGPGRLVVVPEAGAPDVGVGAGMYGASICIFCSMDQYAPSGGWTGC
jgi:hypothetical protein